MRERERERKEEPLMQKKLSTDQKREGRKRRRKLDLTLPRRHWAPYSSLFTSP